MARDADKIKKSANWNDPNWRRYLLLNCLRIVNFIALVLAFWPLILGMEWMDRRILLSGLWPSAFITGGLGIAALVSMLPLQIRQWNLRQAQQTALEKSEALLDLELAADAVTEGEQLEPVLAAVKPQTANLADLEDLLYPVDDSKHAKRDEGMGRHSAAALNEVDAFKAWKRENRQYWISRIMGTVGINVIRGLMMLVIGVIFVAATWSIGPFTATGSAAAAMLLVFYCFEIPHRSYGDIFKNAHLTAHIVMVMVLQIVRYFFSLPMQPDFHLYILFYLTFVFFLTRNQTNIDHLMRQGSRSLSELPHGLRGFNAGLTSLLTLAFPIIYVLRKPIAAVLSFLWDLTIFIISAVMNFLNSLFPEPADGIDETAVSSAVTDAPAEQAEGSYWVRAILTALVITLIVFILRRYGKQMIQGIANGFKRLMIWIAALFKREIEETSDVEEGRYYTDYHMPLDPDQKRAGSLRWRKKQWKRAYNTHRKRYAALGKHEFGVGGWDATRYRDAYRLALAWMDLQEEAGLDPSETVREIARNHELLLTASAITDESRFEQVTEAYEDVRYGERVDQEQLPSVEERLDDLEAQLQRMANRL